MCAAVLDRAVVRKAVPAPVWMVVTRLFVAGLAVRDALPPSSSLCGSSGTVVVCIYPALLSASLRPALSLSLFAQDLGRQLNWV